MASLTRSGSGGSDSRISGEWQTPSKEPPRKTSPLMEELERRQLLTVNVLTQHNDLGRTGLNSNETLLTPANVGQANFGKLINYPVQGQVYAQPLYVSGLTIPGKGTHNAIIVATENNDVYALDANSNSGVNAGVLWHVNLGPAAAMPNNDFGNRYGPYHDINPQVGITGTPVIDLSSNTLYVDAFTHDGTNRTDYSHHIHALDITTGTDKVTPMLVSASIKGNAVGGDGTNLPFTAIQQLQRPALTLLNGVLYVTYGGYADTDPYHGWVIGFNPANLQVTKVFNTTPNKDADTNPAEGGIWMTGTGLSSDGTNLYAMTGNGDFNASPTVGDYGDSFIKIGPDTSTPANPNVNGYGLKLNDYFTPFNEQSLADSDADLGSGGAMVLPDQPGGAPHEMVGAGKQGTIYLVNRDNMGQHTTTVDNVIQKVSLGHGVFSMPAYFNEAVYYQAVNDVLKKYTLSKGTNATDPMLLMGPTQASVANNSGQGSTPSISANGNANGIVWTAEFNGSHEVLHAYDAGTLAELYNSNQNAARDQMGTGVKFITPTIADGQVFVGGTGFVAVYGLINPPTTPPLAPSNLAATANSASAITLNWVKNSDNESGFKIERSTDGTTFSQIALASAGSTSYVDTTVNASTKYFYRVRATNILGDSAYTNIANATTLSATGATDIYHFDAGSGTGAVDSGPGGNNGTLVGATLPTWVSGKIGAGALAFSGDGVALKTNEPAVQVANDLSPILGSTATLTAWIKTTQVGNNTHWQAPAITGVEQAGGGNDINWGWLDAAGHIGLAVGDNANVVKSTNAINDGQWHHVAMTRDATTGIINLYVDGVLNGTATADVGSKTSQFKLIGAMTDVQADGVTVAGGNYLNGQLDEVRIYNQVLGAGEIASMVNVPPPAVLNAATPVPGPLVHLEWTNPTSGFVQAVEVDRKIGAAFTYTPIATLPTGTTMYDDTTVTRGTQYYYVIKEINLAGASAASNMMGALPPLPSIVANSVFYNDSKWDGQNGSSNQTDTNSVATDKQALLPGQTASWSNITGYSRGINGIIIDVANLENLPRYEDFSFTVGTSGDPSSWSVAPVPTIINTYPGRGPGGSTEVKVIWADNAIQNEWLRVALLANPHTNLVTDDVFYYGNLVGDTGNDSGASAMVTARDVAATRTPSGAVTLTTPADLNRDGVVDSADTAIARSNLAHSLAFISVPSTAAPAPAAAAAAAAAPPAVTPILALTATSDSAPTSTSVSTPASPPVPAPLPKVIAASASTATPPVASTPAAPKPASRPRSLRGAAFAAGRIWPSLRGDSLLLGTKATWLKDRGSIFAG